LYTLSVCFLILQVFLYIPLDIPAIILPSQYSTGLHSSLTLSLHFLFSLASLEALTWSTFVLSSPHSAGLLFNPEVRGVMLFQNVRTFLLDYTL
jgi:hypothetical protein